MSLGINSISVCAQTKELLSKNKIDTTCTLQKHRFVEDDGYVWYRLVNGNLYGAQNIENDTIVPIQYDVVTCISCDFFDGNHARYHKGIKGDYVGIYTSKGTCIFSIDNHYTYAGMGHDPNNDLIFWWVTKDWNIGVTDARGKLVIEPIYDYVELNFTNDLSGRSKIMTPYFTLYKDDKQGICLMNGKIICPPKDYKYCYLYNSDGEFTLKRYKKKKQLMMKKV